MPAAECPDTGPCGIQGSDYSPRVSRWSPRLPWCHLPSDCCCSAPPETPLLPAQGLHFPVSLLTVLGQHLLWPSHWATYRKKSSSLLKRVFLHQMNGSWLIGHEANISARRMQKASLMRGSGNRYKHQRTNSIFPVAFREKKKYNHTFTHVNTMP